MKQKTAEEISVDSGLSGKTVLITGCNSGIGFETMRVLSMRGARVIGFARTLEKAKKACSSVCQDYLPVACEMSDFNSIQKAIKSIAEPIDILIGNAGVMWIQERTTYHGIEAHMFINHIAHFAIINGLMSHLTSNGQVIILSSAIHSFVRGNGLHFEDLSWERKYSPWTAYAHSKLANILFVKALAKRLKPGQRTNAVHPGIIDSNLWRNAPNDKKKYALKSVEFGAATSVFLAIDESNLTGQYFSNCKPAKTSPLAEDEQMAQKLWALSIEIIDKLSTTSSKW